MLINKYDLIGVYPRMRGEPNAARAVLSKIPCTGQRGSADFSTGQFASYSHLTNLDLPAWR